jgi:flagellar M-ring protein FliF
MKGLIESIRKLGMVRVAMLAGVTLGIIGAFVWLELQGPGRGRMAELASDLDSQTAQQIATDLTGHKIPYRLEGGHLFVPDSDLAAARALLTTNGLSSQGTTGYEIFDRGTDLAVTDFDQQVKLTRALEGELARTIVSVHGITHARVHLVLPRREPFSRDRLHAQASVMLTLAGRQTLSPEAVQSVVDLVAAGVPGLRPQDVTVVDSNLHLLVQAGEGDDPRAQSAMGESIRQKTEARLAEAVELMLERSLGPGHVHAEASIRMNFDKVNETQEKYDPDGSVVRSTQNVTSNSKSTDKTAPVSLQNNLPNADAGAAGASGSQEGRQEETTNYEIGKTVRAIVHDQPQVERVTLAVMVDGIDTVGADGKHSWKAREQSDLDQIEKLVKSVVGFDEKRGDRLDVVSMPFVDAMEAVDAAPVTRPGKANADLITFIQMVAFGVVGFGIIILTARSIFAALNKPVAGLSIAGGAPGQIAGGTVGSAGAIASGGQPGNVLGIAHSPGEGTHPEGDDDEGLTLSNIQGQMRASSVRKVVSLVDQHPDTTLGIIRGWISADSG